MYYWYLLSLDGCTSKLMHDSMTRMIGMAMMNLLAELDCLHRINPPIEVTRRVPMAVNIIINESPRTYPASL